MVVLTWNPAGPGLSPAGNGCVLGGCQALLEDGLQGASAPQLLGTTSKAFALRTSVTLRDSRIFSLISASPESHLHFFLTSD